MHRNIVVSGGGTGIGRAIARAQALQGDRVMILGRRDEVLEKAASEINAECESERVSWRSADVSDLQAVEQAAEQIRIEMGEVYGVVNNAGGSVLPGPGLSGIADAWRQTFDKNVLSAVLLTTALQPLLRRPGGRIIVIGSMASKNGGGSGHYSASKSAVNAWVLFLSGELGAQGITVNAVLPGYTPDTEIFGQGLPKTVHDRLVGLIALGRAGRSEDVAGAVRYLLSPEAEFVTGHLLEVSGGSRPPTLNP
jgi:3-oxoacyl-[acyl-carrier protein] reductase